MRKRYWTSAAIATGASLAAAVGASAQDFYAGRTINLTVGISAGGGYDQYARLLARHYSKHIPGNPTIIVRNMPGAGSLNAVLYTADIAPPDGLTVTAFNSGLVNEAINDSDKAKIKFDQFAWVGSIARDLRVCFAMKDSSITSIDDLKTRKAVFGGSGVGSSATNNVAMMRNLFALDLKIISAYRGNTEMFLAAERGEISGSCVSWSSVPDHWTKQGKINLLARLSRGTAPDLPDSVKFLGDMTPSAEAREIIDFLMASGEVGRPLIVSRKVPADRIKILQQAFDATMRDPDFLAEAAKQNLPISPVDGAEAQSIVTKMLTASPALVEKARVASKE
jgi:tripartite-type tricarboxylate transporter receptor subunit TctC